MLFKLIVYMISYSIRNSDSADIIPIICKPVRYYYREKRLDPGHRVNVNCQSEVLDAMHQLESIHQSDGVLIFFLLFGHSADGCEERGSC